MALNAEDRALLQRELAGDDGSFLATSLAGAWDATAFLRLARALRVACEATETEPVLERWLAEGVYTLDTQLPRYLPPSLQLPDELVAGVREHIMLLASWYFSGQCPFDEPEALERELVALMARGPG
jgi:hypothetical protein